MKLGRLGVWYSADKHADAGGDRRLREDGREAGIRYAVVSGIARLRIVHRRRLHAVADDDVEDRQFDRVDLRA